MTVQQEFEFEGDGPTVEEQVAASLLDRALDALLDGDGGALERLDPELAGLAGPLSMFAATSQEEVEPDPEFIDQLALFSRAVSVDPDDPGPAGPGPDELPPAPGSQGRRLKRLGVLVAVPVVLLLTPTVAAAAGRLWRALRWRLDGARRPRCRRRCGLRACGRWRWRARGRPAIEAEHSVMRECMPLYHRVFAHRSMRAPGAGAQVLRDAESASPSLGGRVILR
jgi:hypothetical protein